MRAVVCDYFTDAIDYTQVKIINEFDRAELPESARALHGEVRVNRQIVGFKKVKFYTMENVGAGNLSTPEQEMHTTSFWLHFSEDETFEDTTHGRARKIMAEYQKLIDTN